MPETPPLADSALLHAVERQVALLLRRAEYARLTGAGHTPLDRSAYLLLGRLQEGPLGVKALASHFQLDTSTVSRQVAALLQKGYVERLADARDGRASLFAVTALGSQQLEAARRARLALYAELLADWTSEDCQAFAHYLARFNRAIASWRNDKDLTKPRH